MEDGLGWYFANLMIKDANGFMWFGTQWGGLCRFDGAVFEKMTFDKNKKDAINSEGIMGFVEDSLHNIWIGTKYELSRYDIRADTFTNFVKIIDSIHTKRSAVPFWATRNQVYCMETDISIVSYNIHSLERRVLLTLTDSENLQVGGLSLNYTILDTASNCLWMLELYDKDEHRGGLLRISLEDGRRQHYIWPCYRSDTNHRHSALAMRFDRKRNSIWINSSDGLLEFSLYDKQFHYVDALNEFVKLKDYDRNLGIDIDRGGRIWLTTTPKGILIYDPETNFARQLFTDPDLLKKTGVVTDHIYCDQDGIVWTSYWGGVSGIYEFLPSSPLVKRYTVNPKMPDSLSNGIIFTIIPAAKGKLWVGTRDGLNIFDPATEKFEVLREKDLPGIRGTVIVPLYIDTIRQKAWLNAGFNTAGFEMKTYEMDIRSRRCRPIVFRDKSGQPVTSSHFYSNFLPHKNGLMLVADNFGLFEMKWDSLYADLLYSFSGGTGGMVLEEDQFMFFQRGGDEPNFTFENKNGRWTRIPHLLDNLDWGSMFYDGNDQTHWVSFKNELVHYDKMFRKIKAYQQADGYTGAIYNMQKDNAGNLWFSNFLDEIGRLSTTTGTIITLSEADGVQKPNFDWFAPGAKDANGNIYFGSGGWVDENVGLYRIQPERFASAPASSVYLRSLAINRKPFSLSTGVNNIEKLSLRHNQNTISIETGIIDDYAKGKGRLRYKLEREGKDEDWLYAPAYYTIRYDGLAPGSYRLAMQSSNSGNEFNGPEKILMIYVSPPFWETWWFRTLAITALLLLFYSIYRWRTAALRKQKRILEKTVKIRTAELERQKGKSDELLLNILPSEVADELKEKGYTTAKSFDEVTVLFSDIKGFTSVAERMTAQELVKEINTYFSAFDGIIQKYGLEKIKTIGDAYIAAGGLPEKNSATARNVIEAAIAMQQAVEKLKSERELLGKPYFELRIGIHTGPVVAGVVGIKKFQYDIWGDTVNLAARMEQSGVPGRINISQHTYELIKGQFSFVHRGKIEAKNKGEIDMYFVE
jgi:class 3 adenylate cyclase